MIKCARCGGPWGKDETCSACTDEYGHPRPASEQTTTLELDEVSMMMLALAFATKANEPALPHFDDATYAEQARLHDRWEQEFYATVLMLGIRLVNRLLEG